MDVLTTLGRTLGFSFAAGINLYATVALLGPGCSQSAGERCRRTQEIATTQWTTSLVCRAHEDLAARPCSPDLRIVPGNVFERRAPPGNSAILRAVVRCGTRSGMHA